MEISLCKTKIIFLPGYVGFLAVITTTILQQGSQQAPFSNLSLQKVQGSWTKLEMRTWIYTKSLMIPLSRSPCARASFKIL